MCGMIRGIFRWGIISALALGGLTLLVGPERVAAGFSQIRAKVGCIIDKNIDDPVALRQHLRSLADQYPGRIAEVRGELAKVQQQLGQFERDCEVSQRVVAMTADDLGELKQLVARAEAEKAASARPVAIRFEGARFDLDEAYLEAGRINTVRLSYQDRLASNQQQITMLGEQKARLSEILVKLETEYNSFQSQSWQLDRQIDAIERNDRLIQMTRDLQETLDGYERLGKIGNLKQLEGKLAELRTVQEAQLKMLKNQGLRQDYHSQAERDVDMNDSPALGPDSVFEGIEIKPEDDEADAKPSSARLPKSVAKLEELVIIE